LNRGPADYETTQFPQIAENSDHHNPLRPPGNTAAADVEQVSEQVSHSSAGFAGLPPPPRPDYKSLRPAGLAAKKFHVKDAAPPESAARSDKKILDDLFAQG
jgi:hypothetical protein